MTVASTSGFTILVSVSPGNHEENGTVAKNVEVQLEKINLLLFFVMCLMSCIFDSYINVILKKKKFAGEIVI